MDDPGLAASRTIGKGRKTRLIPVSGELTNTVDEYMLTEYVLLERTPIASDHLWYPVYRVGERVIGLKPERSLSYRGFYEWWKRVEAAAGVRDRKPHMTRHSFATTTFSTRPRANCTP